MNKQLVFGVIAVVFATALIASLVVDQANAQRSNRQSISQHNHQHQSSSVVTAGAGSTVTGSGNNDATDYQHKQWWQRSSILRIL